MRTFLTIFTLAWISPALASVKFVPPNDSQPLLRRDLIPLDVDAIRELAAHLAILADGPPANSPALLRKQVQALTLSQRLAPTQARAREIMQALSQPSEDSMRPALDPKLTTSAQRSLLTSARWLVKLPPDSEGHHLAQLLLDILHGQIKQDRIFTLHHSEKSPQRWEGVVAKLAAFEEKPKAPILSENNHNTPPTPLGTPPRNTSDESPTPTPTPTPAPAPKKFLTTTLLTEVPMIATGPKKESPTTAGLVKTTLVITKQNPPSPEQLRLLPKPDFSTAPLQSTLIDLFKALQQDLPTGHHFNVNTDGRRYLSENQENLAAPIAMMLDAALSGRSLRNHSILLAHLHPDGSLGKPAQAWKLLLDLERLRIPEGTRLIVGPDMIEELTALLVFEKAPFFTKFEVIEAPTFQAARELFYQDGQASAALAAAIAGYQEVREKAQLASNFNTFFSLSAVEKRLIKARDHSPQHLSARMLATQSIRRPAYLSRFMCAQELDRKLEGISQLKISNKIEDLNNRAIKDAYKTARESIDPLERLLQLSERALLDDTLDLLKKLNSIGRIGSTSSDQQKIERKTKDFAEFQTELTQLRKKLRRIYHKNYKK